MRIPRKEDMLAIMRPRRINRLQLCNVDLIYYWYALLVIKWNERSEIRILHGL
jgi:hypothetical protein